MVGSSEAPPRTADTHAEQVFYNIHHRASIFYLRHTNRFFRSFAELFWMVLASSGFAALIMLHLTFVYRGNPVTNLHTTHPLRSIPSTCLPSIEGFRADANVTHLVLLQDKNMSSFAWEIEASAPTTTIQENVCTSESCQAIVPPTFLNGQVHFSFSKTKGYALMTPDLHHLDVIQHGIPTQIVAISKTDARCFGEPFLQETVFRLLGSDLVMMNWLLAISNGTGFIYNPRTDETTDLKHYVVVNNEGMSSIWDWHEWFWTSKFRTAVKTCLIYFISTNLVSFLLKVAQERLLELSLQIQQHQQEHRSIIPLFVTHVADCFVFVPITVGVLFYLREFYEGKWVIALAVLAVVFVCELFSFVSCRTAQGIFFFPRAFFLLFCLVHFYLFSFPFGFSYVAMGMIVCFMLQCVTFFWNRYEVPAVALGRVSIDHRTGISNVGGTPTRDNTQRQANSSTLTRSVPVSPNRRSTEPILRVSLQPQYNQQPQPPIHYTYSQGAFSQGRMSRASSEAIFQRSGENADDESDRSCLYFLGGEVVIRRGDDQRWNTAESVGDSNQMHRYDSSSTIQSAVAQQLGTITDEAATSGLQAIHDLTPRLCNLSRGLDNGANGAPVFPVLDSSRSRVRQRRTDNE